MAQRLRGQERAAALPVLSVESVAEWEKIFLEQEKLGKRLRRIGLYEGCLST